MTYEEAHRFLEVKQRNMTQNRHLYNETAIAINGKAIEALGKQIPRKIIIDDGYDYCPTCGYNYGSDATRRMLYKWRQPFCKECGQALDWRNEK